MHTYTAMGGRIELVLQDTDVREDDVAKEFSSAVGMSSVPSFLSYLQELIPQDLVLENLKIMATRMLVSEGKRAASAMMVEMNKQEGEVVVGHHCWNIILSISFRLPQVSPDETRGYTRSQHWENVWPPILDQMGKYIDGVLEGVRDVKNR